MVLISKAESKELNKKYKIKFGENGISHTYSRNPHYYLCESPRNMGALNKLRQSKIIK